MRRVYIHWIWMWSVAIQTKRCYTWKLQCANHITFLAIVVPVIPLRVEGYTPRFLIIYRWASPNVQKFVWYPSEGTIIFPRTTGEMITSLNMIEHRQDKKIEEAEKTKERNYVGIVIDVFSWTWEKDEQPLSPSQQFQRMENDKIANNRLLHCHFWHS